jgi:hypothetical protein
MRRAIQSVVGILGILLLWVAPAGALTGQAKQLNGDIAGTSVWSGGGPGCDYVDQTFDGTYTGGPGAGPITLHIHACVSGVIPTVGTFTLATRTGSLAGDLTGTFTLATPVVFEFDLTPTSGTGSLAHQVKSLHVHIEWFIGNPSGSPFTGHVTAT